MLVVPPEVAEAADRLGDEAYLFGLEIGDLEDGREPVTGRAADDWSERASRGDIRPEESRRWFDHIWAIDATMRTRDEIERFLPICTADLAPRPGPATMARDTARRLREWASAPYQRSNLKAWLLGTHRGVGADQLPVYLDEFVFRWNRRRTPMAGFQTLLGLGTHREPTTYEQILGRADGDAPRRRGRKTGISMPVSGPGEPRTRTR